MINERIHRQIQFIKEIDRLKQIFRQTYLLDESRKENDAEHSWHLAVMAMVLHEYAEGDINLLQVMKMVLLHDIVEIDAGDTYCYDDRERETQEAREKAAADRIFALLPRDQEDEFRNLWNEFEARETPEARFASVLDRLQPLIHNHGTGGRAWQEHGITSGKILERNADMGRGSEILREFADELIEDSIGKGFLKR
ncbi:MAG TPA: HD domain-containing protein [Spirochaetota bacterium]|nr:HD domain-containing protein [Spirochaetota bacterium]